MTSLVPAEFLFRCTFPVPRLDQLPRRGQRLLNLPEECVLPSLAELSNRPTFAELRMAWNDNGLAVSLAVEGRTGPPVCDLERPGMTDGLRIWVDTRNTQTIHRASRFCQQFEILPTGGGADGQSPTVTQLPIARAKEEPPAVDADLIPVQSTITSNGYTLEAWFPTAALHGFDPSRQSKLGFYYAVNDAELGLQTLSVGAEFPFANDPSLWSTLELVET